MPTIQDMVAIERLNVKNLTMFSVVNISVLICDVFDFIKLEFANNLILSA